MFQIFWRFQSALLHLIDVWCLKFRLLSSQAPRDVTISNFFFTFSPQTLIFVGVDFFRWWLVANRMNSVLLAFILSWLLPIHSSMLFIVDSSIFIVFFLFLAGYKGFVKGMVICKGINGYFWWNNSIYCAGIWVEQIWWQNSTLWYQEVKCYNFRVIISYAYFAFLIFHVWLFHSILTRCMHIIVHFCSFLSLYKNNLLVV